MAIYQENADSMVRGGYGKPHVSRRRTAWFFHVDKDTVASVILISAWNGKDIALLAREKHPMGASRILLVLHLGPKGKAIQMSREVWRWTAKQWR